MNRMKRGNILERRQHVCGRREHGPQRATGQSLWTEGGSKQVVPEEAEWVQLCEQVAHVVVHVRGYGSLV